MTHNLPHPLSHWWTTTAWTWVRDSLIPPTCAACDATPVQVAPFCHRCHTASNPADGCSITTACDWGVIAAAGLYQPPLSVAVRRMKFQGRPDLAGPLSRLVTSLPLPSSSEESSLPLLVPVPLHPQRLAERGYNPAALLARHWARNGMGQYAGQILRRNVNTRPQSLTKSRKQRQANLTNAFGASHIPNRQPIILVDDVVTTGATLTNCAQALLCSGAGRVNAQVIACTSPLHPPPQP